jgi:hypothetical protein
MSIENENPTHLTPAPRIFLAKRSTPLPEKIFTQSQPIRFKRAWTVENQGQKDSRDWHPTNGLLRLAQGLQQDHEAQEERLKSFARSSPHRNWREFRTAAFG